ncbi:IclR family transcriptional regulator domain-containing protein [Nocardia fluminea]|uniref:IclR family transcriptional regulator domain-containing protein n=1 Tax=Nocardia fluminea TaxID=134984 RepID=UPI0033F4FF7F
MLARQLDDTRRNGVALEREESALGGSCLAAPVLVTGRPVATLSVSVPADRFVPGLLAAAVRTAALALARVLPGRPGPPNEPDTETGFVIKTVESQNV